MKFYRSIIVLLEMIIFAIGALVIGLIIIPGSSLFFKGIEKKRYCANIIHKSWKFFTVIMQKSGSISVEISEDFSDIKGKIIVANHPSLIDIVLLIGLIPNSLCFAKKALLKNPVMHNIVKTLYIINDISPEELKTQSSEALKNGFNIVIFPSGTRTRQGEDFQIHKGAAQIAIDTKTDIVPVNIELDYPLLIKNHFPLDAGIKPVICSITRKPDIKISEFAIEDITEIKLRKRLSEKIKASIISKS